MQPAAGVEIQPDVNASRSLFAAILIGVIGPEMFIVQPGFVQGLVQYVGFDEQAAGYTASAEMFGIAATTIALIFLASRVDWRKFMTVALLTMFAANVGCLFVRDLQMFALLRFVAGLGAGAAISLSFTTIGLTRDPDRNFGLLITWLLVYGALALLAMPKAFELFGMSGVLWFFALFPLVALPFVRNLPRSAEILANEISDGSAFRASTKAYALLSMFTYNLAQGVVWTYLFIVGVNAGLGEQQVANALTLSQFAGIGGAFCVTLLAQRTNHLLGFVVSISASALVLGPLMGSFGVALYAFLVSIYNFAWNFTQPLLLSTMARLDRRGKVVVFGTAAQMCGLAAGPSVAATILGSWGFTGVIGVGIALFLASLALMLSPVLTQRRA